MPKPELVEFVKQQLARGVPADALRTVLIQRGWPVADIDAELGLPAAAAMPRPAPAAPPTAGPTPYSQAEVSSIPVRLTAEPATGQALPNLVLGSSLPGSGKKPWAIIAAVIGGVAILGAVGAWAYVTYFPTPEKVINRSWNALSQVTSLEYSVEITAEGEADAFTGDLPVSVPGAGTGKAKVTLSLNGATDTKSLVDSRSSLSVALASSGAGVPLNFAMDFRTIGKVFYARFPDLGNLGFVDLSGLKNRWIKIDTEAIAQSLGGNKIPEAAKSGLKPEDADKVRQALREANLITITKKLPGETVDGVATYHYQFELNREGIKKFITAVRQITGENGNNESLGELYYKIDTAQNLPTGELWISKSDYLPRKLLLAGEIKDDGKMDAKKGPVTYAATLNFKSFNQPVTVETPTDARDIKDIIEEYLGPMMMGLFSGFAPGTGSSSLAPLEGGLAPIPGLEGGYISPANLPNQISMTDSDNDRLEDSLESMIGTDPSKADSDGDGYKDGDEIDNGYNPLGPGPLPDSLKMFQGQ